MTKIRLIDGNDIFVIDDYSIIMNQFEDDSNCLELTVFDRVDLHNQKQGVKRLIPKISILWVQ